MPDVIDQLRSYAEAAEAAVPEAAPVPGQDRRGRFIVAVAAAIVVLAGVVAVVCLQHRDDRLPVSSGLTTSTPATTSTEPVPAGGRWESLPAAPIAGRVGHVMVTTGDELIVWGGRNGHDLADGAAWSFSEHRWRKLAPSPLSPRSDPVAVWTGTEVLVWGGVDQRGGLAPGGAAYDPATDVWRKLPDAPFGAQARMTGATWTGSELVLVDVVPAANAYLATDAFALDPVGGRWRPLPRLQPQAAELIGVHALWHDGDVVVVRMTEGSPVTVDQLDLDGGGWRTQVETSVQGPSLDPSDVVLDGDDLVLAAGGTPGAIVSLPGGAETLIPGSGSPVRFSAQLVAGVVTVGDRYLVDHVWHHTAALPEKRAYAGTAVHDGRYYAWGGAGCLPQDDCVLFIGVPALLVWSPPTVAEPSESTTRPAIPAVELSARMACAPDDALAVEVVVTSARPRTVAAETVLRGHGETVVGGPVTFDLPAERSTTRFIPFNRSVDELPYAVTVVVKESGTDEFLAGYIVPMTHPRCG